MTRVLDGKATAAAIRREVATEVAELVAADGRAPGLVAVLVGDDPASHVYVGSKMRASAEVGIASRTERLPADVPAATLGALLDRLNAEEAVDGILVQLPLPSHLDEREMLSRVAPEKDVDGFHPANVGRLWLGEPAPAPATPSGIVELLRRHEVPLAGRRAVVVGRSNIVGKPMAALLLAEHMTVTVCHSRTRDLEAVCREADLLVAAVGRPGLVGADAVSPGTVVVDVGMNRVSDPELVDRLLPPDSPRRETFAEKGSLLVGDVDYHAVFDRVAAITPVPGGVGPLTVAMLLVNTLAAARRRQGLERPPR